eukprot:Gregarina_sp_Poly_1__1215@NODE_1299_length_4435_cov_13_644231_g879_i0_p2_GENE_NODE_1299_length_4435_cov_13_644231_g879_i0NODE_1299_length_4435_cov_13_644231_g879_i0_p2_ORF_typecomplete_len277_score26_54DUF1335/PF07056_11/0_1DUF1335/PF07056_11/9_4e03_NODE_1299_length_4435_cov_13_644231_g879_i033594189
MALFSLDEEDALLFNNVRNLAIKYRCTAKAIYESSPWSQLLNNDWQACESLTNTNDSSQEQCCWIPLGRANLEFYSNISTPTVVVKTSVSETLVAIDIIVSYPRFMHRKYKVAPAASVLWRTLINQNQPLGKTGHESLAASVLNSIASSFKAIQTVSIPRLKQNLHEDELNPASLESYISNKLASSKSEELVSAMLMVMTPRSRTSSGKSTNEFVSGNFLASSGNTSVKLLVDSKDTGKLVHEQANVITVLLFLNLIEIRPRSPEISHALELGKKK